MESKLFAELVNLIHPSEGESLLRDISENNVVYSIDLSRTSTVRRGRILNVIEQLKQFVDFKTTLTYDE